MRCNSCKNGEVRLVRYEHGLGVWSCRCCEYESLLLDCEYCERRLVRKNGIDDKGRQVWACYRCQQNKSQCDKCRRGWLRHTTKGEDCDFCGDAIAPH